LFLSILWSVTANDGDLRRRAFAGLKRFQTAPRASDPDPAKIAAQHRRASLLTRNCGAQGSGDLRKRRAPVVLIPSLINPPNVLDLTERRSLLRYLAARGHDVFLLDWGTPSPDERAMDLAGHVEDLLLPLLETLEAPPILVGYCLGGTLALGAAVRLQDLGRPASGVATIASPWDFSRYDNEFRSQLANVWAQAKPGCEPLGLVPMEVFQTGFWSLDPKRTIRKYADFGEMEAGTAKWFGFIALEDWANQGAPLTFAAGRDLAERCYATNMTASGEWSIAGTTIGIDELNCPTLAITSTTDRIVPAFAAPLADERIDLSLGHVGMMIGGQAEPQLWSKLSDWLSRCGG
jgi:polyhydroxyalkanoate synthase